ncbi:zinc finger protein 836-like isoform X2 [Sitophilus oryzae]|uniref:Zinc finger protein 836-like isoform X2 n=1 Tax=Sitophilus oryzae TaxID=7048 RepID=A0A6J2Y957_SITOR|nr:zinc finger protein 836-like isoform X2 [Sitophilus oryzae]
MYQPSAINCSNISLRGDCEEMDGINDKQEEKCKPYKCTEPNCNAAFMRPSRLHNHQLTHLAIRPYACDYPNCNKSYTSQSHLKRHEIISHLSPQPPPITEVACTVEGCRKYLANKDSLKKHIRVVHSDKRLQFVCTDCPKRFKTITQLHFHMIGHGKDVPYKCDKCDIRFIEYHLFLRHKRNHKVYVCDCEKSFDRFALYRKHKTLDCELKSNVEHKCTVCDKRFIQKQHLTQHTLMVHADDSEIETFKCSYLNCNKEYKYKKNLMVHTKTFHEKIFNRVQCQECGKVLKSNKNLKQHLRICGLPPKEKRLHKPRKDKGIPRKSIASELSGLNVIDKHLLNIENCMENELLETQQDIESTEESTTEENSIEN